MCTKVLWYMEKSVADEQHGGYMAPIQMIPFSFIEIACMRIRRFTDKFLIETLKKKSIRKLKPPNTA